jgi:cold shock CspA family protein
MSSSSSSSVVKYTGRVKWFNNKAGYGFVTITDGPTSGTDVFVHHSSINVDSEQYKYLVQGEYIEFSLSDYNILTTNIKQASEVSGIKGGKLMCETRRETRSVRTQYQTSNSKDTVKMPKPQNVKGDDEGNWTKKSSGAVKPRRGDRTHQ